MSGAKRDQDAIYGMSEQVSGLSDGDDMDDGESRPHEVDDADNESKRRYFSSQYNPTVLLDCCSHNIYSFIVQKYTNFFTKNLVGA